MNSTFYKSPVGNSIMDSKNFSLEIEDYLAAERNFLASVIQKYSCQHLIEVGCDVVRLAKVAAEYGINYIGNDYRPELLEECTNELSRIGLKSGAFVNDDIFNLLETMPSLNGRMVIILPFNFLGNMTPRHQNLLQKLTETGHGIIISQFNITPHANAVRREYYSKCASHKVQCEELEAMVLFSSDRFKSISFKRSHLTGEMRLLDYREILTEETDIYALSYFESCVGGDDTR